MAPLSLPSLPHRHENRVLVPRFRLAFSMVLFQRSNITEFWVSPGSRKELREAGEMRSLTAGVWAALWLRSREPAWAQPVRYLSCRTRLGKATSHGAAGVSA